MASNHLNVFKRKANNPHGLQRCDFCTEIACDNTKETKTHVLHYLALPRKENYDIRLKVAL